MAKKHRVLARCECCGTRRLCRERRFVVHDRVYDGLACDACCTCESCGSELAVTESGHGDGVTRCPKGCYSELEASHG